MCKEPLLHQLLGFHEHLVQTSTSFGTLNLLQKLSCLSVLGLQHCLCHVQCGFFLPTPPKVLAAGRLKPAQLLRGATALFANFPHQVAKHGYPLALGAGMVMGSLVELHRATFVIHAVASLLKHILDFCVALFISTIEDVVGLGKEFV